MNKNTNLSSSRIEAFKKNWKILISFQRSNKALRSKNKIFTYTTVETTYKVIIKIDINTNKYK